MTNKINIREDHSEYRLTPRGERIVDVFDKTKKLGKEAVKTATKYAVRGVAVGAAGVSLAIAADQLQGDVKFKGHQTVQIGKVGQENGTLREAAYNHVDGVNGDTIDETLQHAEDDPRNAHVLKDKDGLIVHPGDVVHFADSVERN